MSLREPVDRMVSAYKNKVSSSPSFTLINTHKFLCLQVDDGTVHRHLGEHLYHGGLDKRKDSEVHGYKVPSLRELALRVNRTLQVFL